LNDGLVMARLDCWALVIKSRRGAYVKLPPGVLQYSPYRTMLFKSRKAALDWAQADPYWCGKVDVEKVTVTTKGFME
jgi:hypothetical protein